MQESTCTQYVVAGFVIPDRKEREMLKLYAETQSSVKIAGLFSTGLELLSALKTEFYPQVLVLDPFVDDINIYDLMCGVRSIVKREVHIAVLCTQMSPPEEIRCLLTYGAEYIILKPCELAKMFKDLCMLAQGGGKSSPGVLRAQFSDVLSQTGVSRRLCGCHYVQRMVLYALGEDPNATVAQLYQVVADSENVSISAVMAAVRRISRAMQKNSTKLYQEMCVENGKPIQAALTNAELITSILEHISKELKI